MVDSRKSFLLEALGITDVTDVFGPWPSFSTSGVNVLMYHTGKGDPVRQEYRLKDLSTLIDVKVTIPKKVVCINTLQEYFRIPDAVMPDLNPKLSVDGNTITVHTLPDAWFYKNSVTLTYKEPKAVTKKGVK